MLVLSRKNGEGIRIDDDVLVSVLEVRGNRVRLGITAPRGVTIHRSEFQSCQTTEAEAVPVMTELRQAN